MYWEWHSPYVEIMIKNTQSVMFCEMTLNLETLRMDFSRRILSNESVLDFYTYRLIWNDMLKTKWEIHPANILCLNKH